jgi:hypothetical protein
MIFSLLVSLAAIFFAGCPAVLSPLETPAAAGPNVLVVQIAGEAAARTALPSMPATPTYNISVTRSGTELGGAEGVPGPGPFYIQLSENPTPNDTVVNVAGLVSGKKWAEGSATYNGTPVTVHMNLLTEGTTGSVDLTISFPQDADTPDEITAVELSLYRSFQNYKDKVSYSVTRYRKEGYGAGVDFPSSGNTDNTSNISLTGDYSPGTYVAQIDFFRPNGVRVSRLVQTFVVRGNLTTNTWVETGNKTLTWNAFPFSSADLAEENGIVIEGIKDYAKYKTTYDIYRPVSEIPDETTITVAPGVPGQTIAVSLNGTELSLGGGGSATLSSLKATNSIVILVTAPDGVTQKTYTVGYIYYYNAGIWYVDEYGNDNEFGFGNEGQPYATLQHLLKIQANPDDPDDPPGIVEKAYAETNWPGKAEGNPLAAQIHINGAFTGADALVNVDGDVHPPILLTGSGTIDVSGISGDHRPGAIQNGGTLILGDGVTLTGGVYALQGSKFIMNGGSISGNTAPKGGGVFVTGGSSFTMNGGTIIGNTASGTDYDYDTGGGDGGGGVYVDTGCTFTMNGGTIGGSDPDDKNTASRYGGGVYVNTGAQTKFIMTGGTIRGNTANSGGGGVYVHGSSFDMSGGTISGNTVSGGSGGGVYVTGGGSFTMTGGTIEENTVLYGDEGSGGGGVFVTGDSSFTMTGGTISGNTLRYDNEGSGGGGVYVDANGDFTMTGGTISGNTASENSGGGLYVTNYSSGGGGPYKFTMSGESSINGNSGKRGGGVYMESGIFAMDGGSISGNTASESGGGVYVETLGEGLSGPPDFTMSGGTISGNSASGGSGGGVCVNAGNTLSKFAMNGGTISGNTASSNGGGVYYTDGNFTMSAGTISGNTANGDGGGVYHVGGDFTMTEGLISENSASNGGGVFFESRDNYDSSFTMDGGVISKNSASNGGGVYLGSTRTGFNMKRSMTSTPLIDQDNDVWLATDKTINISAPPLGGGGSSPSYMARITPEIYLADIPVLSGDPSCYTYFTVTPQGDGTKWEINGEGKLQQAP